MADLTRKKTIPMVGAPNLKTTKRKTPGGGNKRTKPVNNTTKKVVKKKNTLKNKNIVDTKLKNIVPMVKKKVNQKIKNIKNSTPKELVTKVKKNVKRIIKNSPHVKVTKKLINDYKTYRDSKPLSKSPKPRMNKYGPKY